MSVREPVQPRPDEQNAWVDAARSGDRAAFERLYRAHSDRIYALCWRLGGGDAALAEDLVPKEWKDAPPVEPQKPVAGREHGHVITH